MSVKTKNSLGGSATLKAKSGLITNEIEMLPREEYPPTDPRLLPTAYGSSWSIDGTYGDELENGCYNIAAIVNLGTGRYRVTFETPMDNVNYRVMIQIYQGNAIAGISVSKQSKTVNGFEFWTYTSTGQSQNSHGVQFLILGGKN